MSKTKSKKLKTFRVYIVRREVGWIDVKAETDRVVLNRIKLAQGWQIESVEEI